VSSEGSGLSSEGSGVSLKGLVSSEGPGDMRVEVLKDIFI